METNALQTQQASEASSKRTPTERTVAPFARPRNAGGNHTAAAQTAACSGTTLEPTHLSRAARTGISLVLTCALALPFLAEITTNPTKAHAVTSEIDAEPTALQQEVERTASEHEAATARVAELEKQISENAAKISELEAALPEQQDRGADAMRTLYKMQQDLPSLIHIVFGAGSFNEFITNINYIDKIQQKNVAAIELIKTMQDELEATKTSLEQAKVSADEESKRAEEALVAAQAAREEAQRKALEEAKAQAAALAAEQAAQAAAQQAAEEKARQEAEAAQGSTAKPETPPASSGGGGSVAEPPSDNVAWDTDKTAFVNEWAPRINAYLAGSPLAGQGETFAVASWNYGVDPRWSPAISNTESSKGLYCFKSHNAWGWGNVSWDSWEEAIDSHVRGLARGYGYTISVEAAKKYCPPNWEHWYNTTVSQMNMI